MLVRFSEMIKDGKTPEQWDCSECQGRRRCCLFNTPRPIIVSVPARPDHGTFELRSVGDVPALLIWARELDAYQDLPDLSILISLGVCPVPIFTPLSSELLKLYHLGQGTGDFKIAPGHHYDQPAFYMAAMNIIAGEQAQARAGKARTQDG